MPRSSRPGPRRRSCSSRFRRGARRAGLPLQSPLVWDFAHVAHFEELWLLRNLPGTSRSDEERHEDVYDGAPPRAGANGELPALRPDAARAYAADVRERVLRELDHIDFDAPNAAAPQGVRLRARDPARAPAPGDDAPDARSSGPRASTPCGTRSPPDRRPTGPDEIAIEAGSFILGATDEPWAYDNELVPHEVEVRPFLIDRAPVTNAAFAEFVGHGGYARRSTGARRAGSGARPRTSSAPLYWERGDDGWERVRFGRREPLPLDEPVQHVS